MSRRQPAGPSGDMLLRAGGPRSTIVLPDHPCLKRVMQPYDHNVKSFSYRGDKRGTSKEPLTNINTKGT